MEKCPKCGAKISFGANRPTGTHGIAGEGGLVCLERQRDALRAELDGVREKARSIPANRLELLADWFDRHEANDPDAGVEVQLDLRRWARTLREIATGGKP